MSVNPYVATGGLLLASLLSGGVRAQPAAPIPSFYATYQYTAYTVYDTSGANPPTAVRGVGGTLTLRPDGTYEKHLSIGAPGGPRYFNQAGRFALAGDSVRFAFTDSKGADVQRGTFRFVPATRRLTLTIMGYPSGNRGVYERVATANNTKPARRPARAKTARKARP